MRDGYPKITYIKDLSEIKYPVNKIQTIEDEQVTTQLALDIQNEFKDQYEVFRTCPRELEVLPKGYSKGATLVRMMDMFGWDKDKVFTFGDGENDVSMFGVVTHSFAMGQALDYVKEKQLM